ncbi:adenylyl cyclase-associated protein 1-like isoform X3 [Argonauta hians]
MFCCTGCRKSKSKKVTQVPPGDYNGKDSADGTKDPVKYTTTTTAFNGVEPSSVPINGEKVVADSNKVDRVSDSNPQQTETDSDSKTKTQTETEPELLAKTDHKSECGVNSSLKSSGLSPENNNNHTPAPPPATPATSIAAGALAAAKSKLRSTPQEPQRLASELSTALAIAAEERERLKSGEMSAEQMVKSIERLETAVTNLERVSSRLENIAIASGKTAGSGNNEDVLSPFVVAYDGIIKGTLAKFLSLSTKISGNVKSQAALVQEAFNAQRSFLVQVSRSKKPPADQMNNLLKPTSSKLNAIQELREKNRRDPLFNHLSAISESIPALGWVTLTTPAPYIKEMSDSALFYTNRVLKEFKEKDVTHVEWAKTWIATLKELQDYAKQYHTTGPTWNPQGGDAKVVPSGPAGFVAPPPPPPPPPPGDLLSSSSSSSSKGSEESDRLALFNSINKGTDITKGLKKVSDDMKTHKNPALRKAGGTPMKTSSSTTTTTTKPSYGGNAPNNNAPLIELQDKKWIIEYQKNNSGISLTDTNMKQTVYIYKCHSSVVKVAGKVNSIVVDNCTKCGIVFDDVISSIEFINCSSVQSQVTGKVPTVNIEKTDGCMVYLSATSLDTEIITAKSSEVNVLVPKDDGGDYTEFFIPEQFKSTWNGKAMTTECCES